MLVMCPQRGLTPESPEKDLFAWGGPSSVVGMSNQVQWVTGEGREVRWAGEGHAEARRSCVYSCIRPNGRSHGLQCCLVRRSHLQFQIGFNTLLVEWGVGGGNEQHEGNGRLG